MSRKSEKTKAQIFQILMWHHAHTVLCGVAALLELPTKPVWWLADICKWKQHALQWGQEDADKAQGRDQTQ